MQTHLSNQIQGFVSEAEMFNLSGTGMEMIGFPKQQQSEWKSFFSKPGPTSSNTMNESCGNFFQHPHEYPNTTGISETGSQNLIVGDSSAAWQGENRSLVVEDSSLRCVFPCEGNERPSQGLSLSLSSNNIGLQSFELRHHQPQPDFASSCARDGKSSTNAQQQQQQQMMLEDVYLSAKAAANLYHSGHYLLTNSKYLVPTQELLNEFCSLDSKQSDDVAKQKLEKKKQLEIEDTSKKHSLTSLELAELHKRKIKLLSMLEEVERRYKHYRNQMKAVVSSFEAVAGNGAATVYSALALKAMSRHFRCLKDGIMGQIEVTRKGMGEREAVAVGRSRGETPRLKIIDQALRQQRAFQQMNMTETHPWRPQRGLPDRSVSVLRAWLFDHFLNPYPSDVDKHILARQTGLSRSQVSNWFINARVRLWKPMVEDMYLEEVKEQENNINKNIEAAAACEDDQKPNIDSDQCASSNIINNQQQHINDFYTSSGGRVSLTLGLKQAPPSQSSVLYPIVRDQIEDCSQAGVVQYSLLDPYRNLMDAQMLHHLPG